ncbi:GGDEF domain-containing protein [Aminipila terrae]|uniref:Diguanylate cyclase n=1 Tax=Aminipila terrae TaxID=2697030 RepID=A0A6P1MGK5_9FIRM|nr:GGDEF domain-containing protein [Aminipila terrae]QHI73830.1 diguanylate cyclase [Aminipila terrae]
MFEFKQINESLKSYCAGENIFDFYRLVDPKTHEIFDYDQDGNLKKQEDCCYEYWGRDEACSNCVSKYAYVKQRQYVKLEFLHGKVMLIISRPVKIKDKMLAMELIKDITSSMLGFNYYRAENKNVENIVSQFNELAVRDILTGLYNLDYIKNYLDDFLEKEVAFNTLVGAAIDIDNYTQINSLYGYNLGNEVLQYVAEVMAKCAESNGGLAGRLGPDEMGIFFINKTTQEMEDICGKIHEEVTKSASEFEGIKLDISFTYAVASLENDDEPEDFIGRLYFNLRTAQGHKL